MAFNLLDAAKNLLPNDLISKAAGSLGESEGSIQKALSGAIPSVLAGLVSKSSGSGGGGILDLVKGAAGSGILSNLTGLFDGGGSASSGGGGGVGATVLGWLRSIFGDKLNNIINAISGFAGIKSSSASAVLSMAAPAALAPIGKYASENNLSASDLGSFLQSQKSSILSALPAGFNLTGALGINSLGDIGGKATEAISSSTEYARDTAKNVSSGNKWLWPLLLLVAIAALIWFFTQKGCKSDTAATDTDTTTTTIAPAPTTVDTTTTTTVGDAVKTLGEVVLPGGVKLQAYPGGIEDQLVKFIQSDEYKNADDEALKQKWFSFDDLNFEFGSTKLTAASKRQLDNIVSILKAFPDVKLKVGAYTDKKGSDAANLKLSGSRAKSVQAAIAAAGAGAQVPEAEGYGEQFATVDENASDKEREADRRTAVRLLKK